MKCTTVHTRLAGYLDDAVASSVHAEERSQIGMHLEVCPACRLELDRYRKLAVLLAQSPRVLPPADLSARIRVAAARAKAQQSFRERFRLAWDHTRVVLDNALRPLTVPATGGVFSAIVVFMVVLQLTVPGTTVRAVPNDVQLNILQPAELITLSDYPQSWAPEQHDVELSLPHGLLLDVTVNAHGQMTDYQILSGPSSLDLKRQLDQMLMFSRFRPMLSFGRPTAGGHVILSFSAVRVRG